jgi:hypothetical protein
MHYLAFFIFIFIMSIGLLKISPEVSATKQEDPQISDEGCILDKVFTFEAGGSILNFSKIELQEHYVYNIRIQLVTPHWCNATVRIYDPDGELFVVFNGTLFQEPSTKSWAEIPFGVAITGNHTFSFEICSDFNVNVYLRIEKGDLCLRDKVLEWEPYKFLLYEVTRFNGDQKSIIHEFTLLSDYKYKFYLARVSAEGNLNTVDFIDLTVSDLSDLTFMVYEGVSLAGIANIDDFTFGTSKAGTYTLNIEITLDVKHENINVAYLIVNQGAISSGSNGTTTNSTTSPDTIYSVPEEVFLFTGGTVGGVLLIIAMIVTVKNRKLRLEGIKK